MEDKPILLAMRPTELATPITRSEDGRFRVAVSGPVAVAIARLTDLAQVLLSTDLPIMTADRVAALIRAIPGSRGQVPIVSLDPSLPKAPPAPDPRPHDPATPDPLARLAAGLGREAAHGLLDRFRLRLSALLDAADPYVLDEGATPEQVGHRIGGLAGLLGFPELAAAWLDVRNDADPPLDAAWTETRIAHAMLDVLLASDSPD